MADQTVLGDYVSFQYGKLPPKEIHTEAVYPIFTGYRISGYSKTYLFAEPEVVVVARGVGGTGDVKLSPPFAYITNLSIVLQPTQPLNKRYLRDYLSLANLRQLDSGAAQSMITIESLRRFPVTLPALDIQNRIAEIIARYDDLIETNRRRITLLEESARLLYREWFVNMRFPRHESVIFKDGLPEDWHRGFAYDFMYVLSGGTPNTKTDRYWGGEIPFFTPKDCNSSVYVISTEKTLTDDGLDACNSRLFETETIFITARGTVGKLALAQRSMAMNQSCYALTPKDGLNNLFLFLALEDGVSHLKGMASGGVFDTIVVDTFKYMPFIRPSIDIANQFGEAVRPVFDQIECLLMQNVSLIKVRNELLPRLMSGAIQV